MRSACKNRPLAPRDDASRRVQEIGSAPKSCVFEKVRLTVATEKNSTQLRSIFSSKKGVTLIEVMISAGIIAMVATGLIYSQLLSNRIAQQARYMELSKVTLRELVDRFQSVDGTDLLVEVTAGATGTNLGFTDVDTVISGTQIYLFDVASDNRLEVTLDRRVTTLASTGNAVLLGATFRLYYTKSGGVIASYDTLSTAAKAAAVLQSMNTNRCIP